KVNEFISNYTKDQGVEWYLETVGMTSAEIYRALWQMKHNGWFQNTNGILLGRASGYLPTKNFTLEYTLYDIFEITIPVIYDADICHMLSQYIFVNGAVGQISYFEGNGTIKMKYI